MRLLSSLSGVEGPDVLAFLYTKRGMEKAANAFLLA